MQYDVLLNNKYKLLSVLGSGTFGSVQLAENLQSGAPAAIKFLRRDSLTKYVENEIVNHSSLKHPHIIDFKEVFVTDDHVCIVMEYASDGNLFDYVRKREFLEEGEARWFFQQLMFAVDYFHKRGIANRDLKLENILLQRTPFSAKLLVKICDFGYSKSDMESAAKSRVGTIAYMAPEVLASQTGQHRYDGKLADIWSCGVTLFAMLCGEYPFGCPLANNKKQRHKDTFVMLQKMRAGEYEIPAPLDLSAECVSLISRMLCPDAAERITTQEILALPWFQYGLPPRSLHMNDDIMEKYAADIEERTAAAKQVVDVLAFAR